MYPPFRSVEHDNVRAEKKALLGSFVSSGLHFCRNLTHSSHTHAMQAMARMLLLDWEPSRPSAFSFWTKRKAPENFGFHMHHQELHFCRHLTHSSHARYVRYATICHACFLLTGETLRCPRGRWEDEGGAGGPLPQSYHHDFIFCRNLQAMYRFSPFVTLLRPT